ncbi:uncharacterized protein LOC135200056 [Macrobrachium nipponense]|uniref:uncharacterized protein LOC135200056 n=1 Tax=Macrobrachium nipponense TaxID=159736 RepID=UPI0030C84F46
MSANYGGCANHNIPAIAMAVTNPSSLGPPAKGPITVAPLQSHYQPSHVRAYDDSGAQISLIREDRIPRGANVDRRRLITIEGINHIKLILPTVQLRVTRPHFSKVCTLAVASYIPGGYDLLLGQDMKSPSHSKQPRGPNPTTNHSKARSHRNSTSSRKYVHQQSPPLPRREIDHSQFRCKTCNVIGHSTNWPRCPSKLPAADTVHFPQGLAFNKRQEPLSPISKGTLRGIAPPVPVTGPVDLNSLPVPLGSTEQCQAPSSLDVEPPPNLTSAPGPELAPAPNLIKDPPTGDPPTGMELTTAHGQSLVPSSSSLPLSPEDEPPADLTFVPPLENQELPDQESAWSFPLTTAAAAVEVRASPAVGSTSTTVAADTEVGCSPEIPQATTASAPAGVSGLSPESVPPSTPRTGIARSWRNKKKKKGRH